MTALDFYFCPFACSGVSLCALEELDLDYSAHPVNIFSGEQKSPEYLKIHPHGKVPALVANGRTITENASILLYLHGQTPGSTLFPNVTDDVERARQASDLIWCSSGLHPIARQIRRADRLTDGDPQPLVAKGIEMFHDVLRGIEAHVTVGRWWYGDTWSIIDMYLLWLTNTAASAGFPLDDYGKVRDLRERTAARPSAARARAIELDAVKSQGLPIPQ